VANFALRAGPVAALAKRLGGIDERRPLPAFASRSFRRWFLSHQPADGRPVLLWVDTFTDYFTPEVGRAAVRVLEAAGYTVRITPGPVCCGLTWISTGQLDGARRQLRRSLDALDHAIDAGTPVVGLEPSCTAVLRGDLTELLPDDPRARRVRAATRTLAKVIRSGGINFAGANNNMTNSYAFYLDINETNPATGLPWTKAGLNGAEFGVQEIA